MLRFFNIIILSPLPLPLTGKPKRDTLTFLTLRSSCYCALTEFHYWHSLTQFPSSKFQPRTVSYIYMKSLGNCRRQMQLRTAWEGGRLSEFVVILLYGIFLFSSDMIFFWFFVDLCFYGFLFPFIFSDVILLSYFVNWLFDYSLFSFFFSPVSSCNNTSYSYYHY